jgi:hypothetical protein
MYLSLRSSVPPISIEEEDRSKSIKLASWILLGVTVAVFIARQVLKAVVFRKVALDDIFICIATVRIHENLSKIIAEFLRGSLLRYLLRYSYSLQKVSATGNTYLSSKPTF